MTVANVAFAVATLIGTLWGGSKVPWKAAAAKLIGLLIAPKAAAPAVTADVDFEVSQALHTLHRHARDKQGHAILSDFAAYHWGGRSKQEPAA